MKKSLSLIASTVLLASTNIAYAGAIYDYSINNPRGSDAAGDITNVTTRYDTNTSRLSWSYSINATGDMPSDAFWLVLNDGPNPKGIVGELAILYGDLSTNTLQAFEYNGVNGNNSYANPANFLASWDNVMNVQSGVGGSQTVSFDIDVSAVNNAPLGDDWEGIQFAEKVGIWFHPTAWSRIGYDDTTGEMTYFAKDQTSWYDTKNRSTITTEVPEPATLALLGLGMFGLTLARGLKGKSLLGSASSLSSV